MLFEKAKNARNHIVMWLENSRKRGRKCQNARCFCLKTSDFFEENHGTFDAKPRHFTPKKSDVSAFPAEKRLENARKRPENG